MVKQHKTKPNFLTVKLDASTIKLVQEQYPKWVEKAKTKAGFKSRISMELLNSFVVYLGKKDDKFDGIPVEFLNSQDAGTRQIYEHMKKRLNKIEDMPPSTRSAKNKDKPTPEKAVVTKPPKGQDAEDMERVQITAHGHFHGADEKNVKYYQHQPSSDGIEPSKQAVSISVTEKEEESGIQPPLEVSKHQDLKQLFADLVDANAHTDIDHLTFTWDKSGAVTFNVFAAKPTIDQK